MKRKRRLLFCSGCLVALLSVTGIQVAGRAQTPSSSSNSAGALQNTSKIETEVVTITDGAAVPDTITRKTGPFYLLLVNKSYQSVPRIVFDSPTAAAAQIPVLGQTLNLPFLPSARKLASVFNAPPGKYQLKQQANGRVLLTINIEQ